GDHQMVVVPTKDFGMQARLMDRPHLQRSVKCLQPCVSYRSRTALSASDSVIDVRGNVTVLRSRQGRHDHGLTAASTEAVAADEDLMLCLIPRLAHEVLVRRSEDNP